VSLTPERWQQVTRIYELAVEHDSASRDTFLANACVGDEELRREVESLLLQDDARVVLDRPVWATVAPLLDGVCDLRRGVALGPYRIESPLGGGGMGEVFRATDTRLNRLVAIKTLPSHLASDQQVRARFAREARAVAALAHSHICTLYDVGRYDEIDFLVMEYLEGGTLAERLSNGPLSLDVALTHATEIASALDHAHRHGIIHRDLKPTNIMLTPGGAKLLDFGLAKFRPVVDLDESGVDVTRAGSIERARGHGSSGRGETDDAHVTRSGAILGTLRYMAPEQIGGDEADARSDLFSFGAVLYEMLTGRQAFDGESATGIRSAILEREPPSVSSLRPPVPPAFAAVVHRCLAKNRDDRWQTASDVLRELKRVSDPSNLTGLAAWLLAGRFQHGSTTRPASEIRSIAVLPFADMSDDADQGYFADGMTEQLIADLATSSGLRVISRTSVMHYKNASRPVPTIARELQVDGIIEGSIVRDSDKVRMTAKLIQGASGEVLWVQRFDGDLRDVRALSREVAQAITSKVDKTSPPHKQAYPGISSAVDPEVHRHVLLGRHHTTKATEDSLWKAVHYFDLALGRAADNAMAHAGVADAYVGLSGFYVPPREAMPKAKLAAQTAIRLDESIADAHAALGYVHLVYDWDGPAARKALLRALELNPALAIARLHYAAYLTTQGQHEEAAAEIWRAVEFDPVSIRANALATSLLMFTRRYDEAIELARRSFEFEPNAFALAFQGVAYTEQGRFMEAVDNMERAARLDSSATILALQAHVLAVAGRKVQAQKLIHNVEESTKDRYFCPYEIASAYVSLGDVDTAYRWFRKGVEERADCMPWLGVEPWVETFRSDPRYPTLLREIGLDPSAG